MIPLSHQFLIRQSLKIHLPHNRSHLIQRVQFTEVLASRELLHVAVQVLGAHLVVGPGVPLKWGTGLCYPGRHPVGQVCSE